LSILPLTTFLQKGQIREIPFIPTLSVNDFLQCGHFPIISFIKVISCIPIIICSSKKQLISENLIVNIKVYNYQT